MGDDVDDVRDGLVLLSPGANAAAERDLGDVARFVYDWPEERYHADRHRLSGSVLEMVVPGRGDPRELGRWMARKPGRPSSPEQDLGSFVHCGLLEAKHLEPGERRRMLARRFAFCPTRADLGDTTPGAEWKKPNARTTEGKAAMKAFVSGVRGRIPIMPEQQRAAERMFRAVASHPDALALLHPDGLRSEVTGLWRDTYSGRLMRCRFDGLREAEDLIVEIKTDQDPDPDQPRNAYRWLGWGYHRKAALYMDAYLAITGRRPSFAFIFIENDADERFPPRVSVQTIRYDDPVITLGRSGDGDEHYGYRQAIDLVESYEGSGVYQAPWEREAVPFRLPAAVEKRMEFRAERPAAANDIKSRFRGVETSL